jgi:hypothetical protein
MDLHACMRFAEVLDDGLEDRLQDETISLVILRDESDIQGYGNDSRQNGPLSSRVLHNEALARTGRGLSV